MNLTKVIFRGCTGSPNDRIFPNTPEMSQFAFSMLFEAFLVNLELPYNPEGALGYFLGGYVPPGTPNWHHVL